MSNNYTTSMVRTTVAGLHAWASAPLHRAYLGQPHRHLFYIEVEVEVAHDDREIEFHDLQETVRGHFETYARVQEFVDFGGRSCERIAAELLDTVNRVYGPRRIWRVTVLEDNEVGGTVYASTT